MASGSAALAKAEQTTTTTTAAVVIDRRGTYSLRPETWEQAKEFATMLAQSDMVPKDFRGKPGNVLVAVQMGAEVGLPPMAALQNIAVINGRPSLWGDGQLGVVRAHPDCEGIHEEIVRGKGEDDTYAICTVRRRGEEPITRTFSIADAKRARLWGKAGPWTEYPKRMLQMRARGFACRDAFADALRGLASAEEERDVIETTVVPVRQLGRHADIAALVAPASEPAAPPSDPEPPAEPEPDPAAQIATIIRKLTIEQMRTVLGQMAGRQILGGKDAMLAEMPGIVAYALDHGWTLDTVRDAVLAAQE